MSEFVSKRSDYYWIERIYTGIVAWMMPFLKKSFLTPNMITVTNLVVIVPAVSICAWFEYYIAAAVLIQVYLFFDICDGNLARNKNLCSELGRKIDTISDTIFYNITYAILVFRILYNNRQYSIEAAVLVTAVFIGVSYAYGLLATYYIVPHLRKLSKVRRWGIKKVCSEHKIIFGMDNGMQDVLMTVFLLTPWKSVPVYACIILYLADMCYRVWELKKNERLEAA